MRPRFGNHVVVWSGLLPNRKTSHCFRRNRVKNLPTPGRIPPSWLYGDPSHHSCPHSLHSSLLSLVSRASITTNTHSHFLDNPDSFSGQIHQRSSNSNPSSNLLRSPQTSLGLLGLFLHSAHHNTLLWP